MKILKGSTAAEQLQHVDTILSRLVKRSPGKPTTFVTPIVLNHFKEKPEEDGVVFRQLAGIEGRLTEVNVFVDFVPKEVKAVEVEIKVIRPDGASSSHSMITKKGMGTVDFNLDVDPLSRIVMRADAEEIRNIWIAAIIAPNLSGTHTQMVRRNE